MLYNNVGSYDLLKSIFILPIYILLGMPKLYERTLQQLRGSSYIITLPKEWVIESGLEKGSSVLLAVEPYIIRIIPATKQVKRTAKFMINEINEEQVEEAIKWVYLSGIDELIIIKTEEISYTVRNTIRKLRTVIPGMIISYEDSQNIKIEFAEPAIRDIADSLKTFLESTKRILQEILKYTERKNVDYSYLSIIIEESIGNSLVLARWASKSIIHPALNVSTVSIYGILATATTIIELTESLIETAEITRRNYNIKSELVAGLIKDIVSIINKTSCSIDDFRKETLESFLKMITDEINDIKMKIDSYDLDIKIKIALVRFIEKFKMMIKYLSIYHLIVAIYPY